ncbi:hypothetical protein D9753_06365 [Streptomyces dangxiongensis]|uniref:Uncharacterized protein n=2 Tax=Streptomyces dangxiongensis TaxID=1442032 RepID=A0A3G2J8K3_9ACTN|nr:hypothetical protein D9753_06365 [Streptomyces dangxiongensis]
MVFLGQVSRVARDGDLCGDRPGRACGKKLVVLGFQVCLVTLTYAAHNCWPDARVTVLIAEVEPERLWQRLLQNRRGGVVAHAVRRDTEAVICRLRFRVC